MAGLVCLLSEMRLGGDFGRPKGSEMQQLHFYSSEWESGDDAVGYAGQRAAVVGCGWVGGWEDTPRFRSPNAGDAQRLRVVLFNSARGGRRATFPFDRSGSRGSGQGTERADRGGHVDALFFSYDDDYANPMFTYSTAAWAMPARLILCTAETGIPGVARFHTNSIRGDPILCLSFSFVSRTSMTRKFSRSRSATDQRGGTSPTCAWNSVSSHPQAPLH